MTHRNNLVVCNECVRLEELQSQYFRGWREQRHFNLRMRNCAKEARQGEQPLQDAYALACAQQRLHKAQYHPEQGYKVDPEDLTLIARGGRLEL